LLSKPFGIPSTAHILGVAVMGTNASEGVIDKKYEIYTSLMAP
jgi:hypothetical protein